MLNFLALVLFGISLICFVVDILEEKDKLLFPAIIYNILGWVCLYFRWFN